MANMVRRRPALTRVRSRLPERPRAVSSSSVGTPSCLVLEQPIAKGRPGVYGSNREGTPRKCLAGSRGVARKAVCLNSPQFSRTSLSVWRPRSISLFFCACGIVARAASPPSRLLDLEPKRKATNRKLARSARCAKIAHHTGSLHGACLDE